MRNDKFLLALDHDAAILVGGAASSSRNMPETNSVRGPEIARVC